MHALTRTTTTAATVLVAGAVLVATAGPSSAAPRAAAASRPLPIAVHGAIARDDANAVAGYAADISGSTLTTRQATATFTVPAVRCTARTTNVLFVQLLLQGTEANGETVFDYGYVVVSCQGTTPTYRLFAATAGADPNGAFAPTTAGDTVRVDLSASSSASSTTITDVTTGAAASQVGTGITGSFVQVNVQGGDAHSVFPKFTKVHFTKVAILGKPLGALNPFEFEATDAAGNVKISTSAIEANRRSFTTTFVGNFGPTA